MEKGKVIDFPQEDEKLSLWDRAKKKGSDLLEWAKENKEVVIPLFSGGIMLATSIIKARSRDERHMKACGIYDRRKGHWVESKRPIKSKEWGEIDRRYENGESYASILDDMRLLK